MRKLLPTALLLLLLSCKKDQPVPSPVPDPVPTTNASMQINFKATVKGQALVPTNKYYPLGSSEVFSVTKFNYYISNVKLKRADGSYFIEDESYHLIKHVDSVESFTLKEVPPGNYVGIEFLIGVDSLRNVSGAQSGDLDPAKLMFWDWNSGYIFLKLEGWYGTATVSNEEYAIHVGGFQAPYSCLQTAYLPFASQFTCQSAGKHSVQITTSIDQIFVEPKTMGFEYYYNEVPNGPKIFQDLSLNYRDMFSVSDLK